MTTEQRITTIDTHTGGEPTRIVVDGVEWALEPGKSVREQRDVFKDVADETRRLLLCEPRGHDDMFGAVLVEPAEPGADIGVFFMDTEGYLDMCGHGTIGVITALIESNRLEYDDEIVVETPAGLVSARPSIEGTDVSSVAITNVESWYHSQQIVEVGVNEEPIDVDVVSAGNTVGLVDVADLSLELSREAIDAFVDLGLEIKDQLRAQMDGDAVPPISLVEFFEARSSVDRNIVVFGDGSVDRSPCGTGTCAKMVLLYRRGELAVEEPYPYESIIGTKFVGRILDVTRSESSICIEPEVSGSAHIIGRSEFFQGPNDPITGFRLDSP